MDRVDAALIGRLLARPNDFVQIADRWWASAQRSAELRDRPDRTPGEEDELLWARELASACRQELGRLVDPLGPSLHPAG